MCIAKGLFVTSAILSFIAVVFFLIGAIGHSDNEDTVESIPWGIGDFESAFGFEGDFYLGLQGFTITIDGSGSRASMAQLAARAARADAPAADDYYYFDDDYDDDGGDNEFAAYDDKDCDVDFCETCEDAGAAAIALTVLALVLSLGTIVFSIVGAVNGDSMVAKFGSTSTAIVAAVFSIVAFAVFRPCIKDFVDFIADAVFGESSGNYGVGGWLTLIGFIIMCISTILSAITCCIGRSGGDTAAPTGVQM